MTRYRASATCPCCGYPTLSARAYYFICEICWWEDDGQDDAAYAPGVYPAGPDVIAGGPNHDYSLSEARANFARHGHMYRPLDAHHFQRVAKDAELRQALVNVFEALLPEVTPAAYIAAMPDIAAASKRISENLRNNQ